jgi:hypothetical protein
VLAVLAGLLSGWRGYCIGGSQLGIHRPDVARVVMIVALIVGACRGGAIASASQCSLDDGSRAGLHVLTYGAGIALIRQMYHLSGDEAAFMLIMDNRRACRVRGVFIGDGVDRGGASGFGYLFAEVAVFDFR